MKLTFLGTGTSHGVPVIGCDCAVCKSTDPRDKRYRSSAYIQFTAADGSSKFILIDIGPDFRSQALRADIQPLSVIGCLDFLGVGRAYRGDQIAVYQRGFHEVRASVAFQLVIGPQAVAKAEHILYLTDPEDPLVL